MGSARWGQAWRRTQGRGRAGRCAAGAPAVADYAEDLRSQDKMQLGVISSCTSALRSGPFGCCGLRCMRNSHRDVYKARSPALRGSIPAFLPLSAALGHII